jgi:multidrug efflux pump
MFIILDDFDARREPHLYASVVAANLNKRINEAVPKAVVNVFPAPAVPGLGRAGGVRLMVQDRGDVGAKTLEGQTRNLVDAVAKEKVLQAPLTVFRTGSPQLRVRVNDAACVAAGVDPLDVYATMQATLGQRYVNDFNRFGRTFQVNVQAASRHRNQDEDVRRLRVRNKAGGLVPLGAVAEVTPVSGPLVLTRYNMYPAASITAAVAPGVSTGVAIGTFEQLADRELPTNMGYEWTELTFLERRSRDTGAWVFVLAVAVAFLVLAALYESWALPLAVILVVPTCVLSALAGVYLAGQDINLFTQVGFVVLVGLACKNAILIVEYAKYQREAGAGRREAVLAACRLRLRPILMTSFAFILGVTTLAFGTGAGSEMRRALGVCVFAGMLGVTAFGVFLTPVFYVLVDWLVETKLVRSPGVRAALRGLLWVFAFGWVRTVVAGRRPFTPSGPPTSPAKREAADAVPTGRGH